ncbi:MAG TPA: hypothetical protein PLC81_06725 [Bacteroidales bacterium]|nr:hypothetical protein [Bacteroidales bacterium]
MMRKVFLVSVCILFSFRISAQNDSCRQGIPAPSLSGYFSDRTSLMLLQKPHDAIWDHELQNRVKMAWQPLSWISSELQIRNRFSFGESFALNPMLATSAGNDRGVADLSFTLAQGKRYAVTSMIDRAFLQLTFKKLELAVGRQRINWSQTLVWNPNDLFNTYSFFDFDYPERPGSDAIRCTWFYSATGRAEMAVKADSSGKITAGGLFRWNMWSSDFQILAAVLPHHELVLGGGWSTNFGKYGFRGEVSWFHPGIDSLKGSDMILSSVSLDVMFYKSWYLIAEVLYRWEQKPAPEKTLMDYYYAPATVKDLAFADVSALVQLNVPVTPLFTVSLAAMGLPGKGFYLGPSFSFSLSNNLEASLISQIFSGRFSEYAGGPEIRQTFYLNFLRFKWNF